MLNRLSIVVVLVSLLATACSSQPETCSEVADETIVLMQQLIDEVELEFEEMSIEDFIGFMASGEELPSVAAFEERAEDLSVRLGELGCTQDQLEADVADRVDQLEATNEIGQFLLDAIKGGGL